MMIDGVEPSETLRDQGRNCEMKPEDSERKTKKFFDKKPIKWISAIGLCLYPFFCWLYMELMNRAALAYDSDESVFRLLSEWAESSMMKVWFGLIVVYLVFCLIYLLVKKAWISVTLFGFSSAVLGFADYMKLLMRGDPFTPMDITLAGQAKELLSFVELSPPVIFFVFVIATLLWIVYLFFAKPDCPGKVWLRLPIVCVLLLVSGLFIGDQNRVAGMLHSFDLYLEDGFLQRYYYNENGFSCGFTMNALSLNVSPPENYSEETVAEALEPYDFSESADAELYDVIIVLNESFFDLREMEGLSFSEDPLKNYDAIRKRSNCCYGTMYSTALGGGTVMPEFQILSGLTTAILPSGASPYMYIGEDTETYITNYQDAGYKTTAIHLYDTSFYRRDLAYEYIGFDELIGLEDLTEDIVPEYSRAYVTDKTTEEAIEYYMDRNTEDGTPSVVFAITIENHQAYGYNPDNTIAVTSEYFDDALAADVNTYTQGLKNADQMLKNLVSYMDQRDRPTVLLFFGDHKPTLGSVHKLYEDCGYYNSADFSTEGRKKIFSTPFLIYTNQKAEAGLLEHGVNNEISDYHLLNAVTAATGFRQTPYMNFLEEMYGILPYYNACLSMDSDLTEEQRSYIRKMERISYDRICGKRYSCE